MDFNVTQETVAINEVVFEGNAEQPVDLDLTLPDYCPDMARVLKCQVTPMIASRQMNGAELTVEGKTIIRLLYVDDGMKSVHCMEQSTAFSATFSLKTEPMSPIVQVSASVDYVNCRAVSSRRADIHGAFTLHARVQDKCMRQVMADAQGCGIQLNKKVVPVSNIVGMAERPFTVSEVLDLPQGKPSAVSILRSGCVARVTDYKAIANKVIVKGDLTIRTLYCSEDDSMELTEHTIPISQIVDLEGIEDDCICDVRFDVLSSDLQLRADSSGENRLICAEVRLAAVVSAYRSAEVPMICDAYSTDYEVKYDSREVSLEKVLEVLCRDSTAKFTFDLPSDDITNVCDLWAEAGPASSEVNDGKLLIKAPLTICLLALDSSCTPVYFERTAELQYDWEIPSDVQSVRADPCITVLSSSFSLMGADRIEVRVEFRVEGCIYATCQQQAMCSLEPDEEHPKQRQQSAALTLYFADQGERVWDIARRYSTSVDAVMRENGLESDRLSERGMLMIPIC